MAGLLDGKVAIVTGGTSGIGLASVELFLGEGASVVIADIQDDRGVEISERLGYATAYVSANVLDEGAIERLVADTVQRFGKLDVMFNNAGAGGDRSGLTDIESAGFDDILALDARSVLLGHKYAARQFRAQDGGGSIVTTASVAGMEGGWSAVGYTAAKHAVAGIVRQAAFELGPLGIRSNAIAPGVIMTAIQSKAFGVPLDQAQEFNDFLIDKMGQNQAMGRFGTAEDVARVAAFLASDFASYVNGVVMPVDGGATAMTQSSFPTEIMAVTKEFLEGSSH